MYPERVRAQNPEPFFITYETLIADEALHGDLREWPYLSPEVSPGGR